MIGYLEGQILLVTDENLYLSVGGVGYELLCAKHHLEGWGACLSEKLSVWVYTHVREDALSLFGFSSLEEKNFFLTLLKVNGVGPKLALNIISGARLPEIIRMIESGDAKALSTLPKVGKKTAEQIILSLKGKLVEIEKSPPQMKMHIEIVSALVNLGFRSQIVEEFVTTLPAQVGTEEGVRQGLLVLTRTPGPQKAGRNG